jgi:peptide-methionine (S)-S-oxide reductase
MSARRPAPTAPVGHQAPTTQLWISADHMPTATDFDHQQYLSNAKNPYGYCNHGPNGLTCPVGVARTPGPAH